MIYLIDFLIYHFISNQIVKYKSNSIDSTELKLNYSK